MAEKYDVGTEPWLEGLRRIVEEMFAAAPPGSLADFTLCEVYTEMPQNVAPTGRLCWYIRVKSGKLDFGTSEIEDTDFKVIAEYSTVLPLVRLTFGDDAEAQRLGKEMVEAAMRDGRMKFEGDESVVPDAFAGLHDALAAITA